LFYVVFGRLLDVGVTLATVVETIPGWSHDITNVGDDEMIVMLWANEIFDRDRPDTVASRVF
jgi:UDP-2-acetamido-2,6-beta-L-arabino-hexul-4-ose reductase